MKRKIGLLGLSLVGVLAFSAVAAGSASADANGPFIDPFIEPITFGGVNAAEPQVLEAENEAGGIAKVKCTGNGAIGEAKGPETGIVGIQFGGGGEPEPDCEAEGIGTCQDVVNPVPGIITTKTLRTNSVFLDVESEPKKFGFAFSANAGPKRPLADFVCQGVRITVYGSLLGQVTGVTLGESGDEFGVKVDVIGGKQEFSKDACGTEYGLRTFIGIVGEEEEPGPEEPATGALVSRQDSGTTTVKVNKEITIKDQPLAC